MAPEEEEQQATWEEEAVEEWCEKKREQQRGDGEDKAGGDEGEERKKGHPLVAPIQHGPDTLHHGGQRSEVRLDFWEDSSEASQLLQNT